MDVISLTNQLTNQPDKIIKILEKLGCKKIKYNEYKGYITSTRPEEGADNPLGNMVWIENLMVHQNTRTYDSNIFCLVMDTKNVNFPKALELVAGWVGLKNIKNSSIKYPFCSFFKQVAKQVNEPELNMRTYLESDLPSKDKLSYKYIKDGVSAQTQEKFGVRYDDISDCIITPIYDYSGRLVGAKARNNNPNCDDAHRFWAFLEYQKTLILFGYTINYKTIIQKKLVIIVESEKAVMQGYDMGCYLLLAIAGHSISQTQSRYIKALGVDKVIVAFDEGICAEECEYEARKCIVDSKFYSNRVGYVLDESNILLPKGSKMSPLDQGKKIFKELIKNYVRWLR